MKRFFIISYLIIVCCVPLWAFEPQQVRAFLFDLDDNLFVLPTRIVLFKKATREEKVISTKEYAVEKSRFGKTGKYAEFELLNDKNHNSYRYVDDVPDAARLKPEDFSLPKNNYLIRDFEEGVSTVGLKNVEGPSFPAFRVATSHAETARFTGIITARGQTRKTFLGFFKYLQNKHLISYLPNTEFIYAVTSPEEKGNPRDVPLEKAKRLEHILDIVDAIELPSAQTLKKFISREGLGFEADHELGFSDDDASNTSMVIKELGKRVAGGAWPHVKISVFKTGGFSVERVVLKSNGQVRPAVEGEEVVPGR